MKPRILPQAEREAFKAAQWYGRQSPGQDEKFLRALQEGYAAISENPLLYPRLETVGLRRQIRRYLLKRFPYLIVYELQSDGPLVVAVAHERQRPNYWMRRRG